MTGSINKMASTEASSLASTPVVGNGIAKHYNNEAFDLGPMENRHVTILYITQSGTSADLALRIARQAQRKRFNVTVCDVASYDVTDLISETLVLFLVSTTGQGEFPRSAKRFWKFLLRKDVPEDILSDLHFAAFGLGDTTYPRFCWPVRLLSRRLKGLGAKEVVEHGEGDEMHYLGLEGELLPWLDKVWGWMDEVLPLEVGVREVGRDERLPPSTKIREVEGEARGGGVQGFVKHLQNEGWSISKLAKNERMSAADHFQDVRLLEFIPCSTTSCNGAEASRNGDHATSVRPNKYRPGDLLCLHPINDSTSVTELLTRLSLDADVEITLSGPTVPTTVPQTPSILTIGDLFTHHLDFTSVPSRSFFEQIRLFSPEGSLEREKLDEYCGIYPAEAIAKGEAKRQEGIDEMFEYAQRPRRSIKEVLEEFKSVSIPLEYVADVLPWIKPREFSIASPPATCEEEEKGAGKEAKAIQVSVAIVKYKTRMRKARTGLCTRWLSGLAVGSEVPILVKEGYLTLPPKEAPLILIGPGTGCAPLRSLVMERLSQTSRPEIHLLLGFRYKAKDYLFEKDWKQLDKQHPELDVSTAFSRDGEEKTYVQDLISSDEERGQVLWNAIVQRNAWIVVAGASGKMPEQVRDAFEGLAEKWGAMDGDEAKRFMDSLERQRRWQQECWS